MTHTDRLLSTVDDPLHWPYRVSTIYYCLLHRDLENSLLVAELSPETGDSLHIQLPMYRISRAQTSGGTIRSIFASSSLSLRCPCVNCPLSSSSSSNILCASILLSSFFNEFTLRSLLVHYFTFAWLSSGSAHRIKLYTYMSCSRLLFPRVHSPRLLLSFLK